MSVIRWRWFQGGLYALKEWCNSASSWCLKEMSMATEHDLYLLNSILVKWTTVKLIFQNIYRLCGGENKYIIYSNYKY